MEVSDLSEDDAQFVADLHVSHGVLSKGSGHSMTLLEEYLKEFVEASLLRTAPEDQLQRCVLLYGPPGIGKTYAVEATAARCGLKLVHVQYSDLVGKCPAESGRRVVVLFRWLETQQPVIVLVDQAESLLGVRSMKRHASAAVTSQLLSTMTGNADSQPGVVVMCCTDMPNMIDPGFVSCFEDRIFEVPEADDVERRVVWKTSLADYGITLSPEKLGHLAEFPLRDLRVVNEAIVDFMYQEVKVDDSEGHEMREMLAMM